MSKNIKRFPVKPHTLTLADRRQIIRLLRKAADGEVARPYSRHASTTVDCCTLLIQVMEEQVRHG